MRIFIYDSTFEGLLSAIYDAYYSKDKPDRIYDIQNYETNLIDELITIETDMTKFEKVYNAIENKISRESLQKIYHVYLTEMKESANLIYSYIRMGFKLGKEVDLHKNSDIVINMDKISEKVFYEKHRFMGFVRFKEINNILYSSITPDFNILPILASHFKNRLTNEYFIIHDIKRDIALIYDRNEYYISKLSQKQKEVLMNSSDVGMYEDLWKEYFKSTNIAERENPRLQKRQMPAKYWDNMVELK